MIIALIGAMSLPKILDVMIDLKKTFKELGEYSVKRIRGSLQSANRVATGKTNNAIRNEFNSNGFIVYGPSHVQALQDGRKKTEDNRKRYKNVKESEFFQQIVEWCRARGIDEGAAYPIYRKINKEGYQGTPNVLNTPIEDIVNNTKFVLAKTSKQQILNSLKVNKQN